MATKTFTSVDQYIRTQPTPVQPILQRVRAVIQKTLPAAVECISYQIPAYKLEGKNVIFFAGWKGHLSLYPIGELVAATLGKELSRYEQSRGTIKIPWDETLPVHLIARIAALRAEETLARLARDGGPAAAKKTSKKAAPKTTKKAAPKKAKKAPRKAQTAPKKAPKKARSSARAR